MSEQEHEQQDEQTGEEREETLTDLDVPDAEGTDVKGGGDRKWVDIELKR
jgi:hypothetical protein